MYNDYEAQKTEKKIPDRFRKEIKNIATVAGFRLRPDELEVVDAGGKKKVYWSNYLKTVWRPCNYYVHNDFDRYL